jgi:Flp pilus assembly protein TadD
MNMRFVLAVRYFESGLYPEALIEADRVVAAAPADGTAWHLKGRAHHLLGDLAAAEAAMRQAARWDGRAPV